MSFNFVPGTIVRVIADKTQVGQVVSNPGEYQSAVAGLPYNTPDQLTSVRWFTNGGRSNLLPFSCFILTTALEVAP
jgi:hypothetical protein